MAIYFDLNKTMREIEFRGRQIFTGEWLYGYLFNYGGVLQMNSALCICCCVPTKADAYRYFRVDPETVGQYTGKKDRDGEKIFEGDILRIGNSRVAEVYWCDEEAQYIAGNDGVELSLNRAYNHDGFGGSAIEIIGNIHDNKLEDFR